jgi:HD-like signal output (HDOD) protein
VEGLKRYQKEDPLMKNPITACSPLALKIFERILAPTTSFQEICDLITADRQLCAKILRLANSSYYSIPGGVRDIATALKYVSVFTVAQLLLTQSLQG